MLAGALLALTGCDKIKAMGGGGADGGASTASGGGGGGGILSFLGGDFEGGITMVVTEKNKRKEAPGQITFDIKKPKYRLDFTAVEANPQLQGGGSMILDPPAKKGYLLVPAQKMAMVIDFEKLKNMPKGHGPLGGSSGAPSTPSTPGTPPKIEKTGKKDTVAGYTCDIWNITTDKGEKAELCLAEGITWFNVTDLGWSHPTLTAAAAISDMNHFPLRIVSYDAKGVEETRMEAKQIEKKKLDDTLFVVPPDYKIMDLSAMMGGMMGGASGGPPGMPSNFPTPPPHRTH